MNLDRIPPATLHAIAEAGRIRATTNNPSANGAANDAGPTGVGDRVEIRGAARELSRARQHVDAAPDVRDARVDALRSQVQAGTYAIDVGRLARRLLGSDG